MSEEITPTPDITTLELEGAPRECGRLHGETLRDPILEIREIFLENANLKDATELEALCWQMLGQTQFIQAAQQWAPELAEEVEGICEGAGVGRGFIWAFQHQDEMISLSVDMQVMSGGNACTSLGCNPRNGSPAILAQNLDTPAVYHGKQTLLKVRYRGSDTQVLTVSEPGLVGICGLNSHGLGVCQNTLANQMNRSRQGLAAMLVVRSLLAQPSLEEAIRFLNTAPHASGINYALGDPGGVADIECSPNRIVRFMPGDAPGRIYHTNHPLVNPDRYPLEHLPQATQEYYKGFLRNSQARLESLRSRLAHTSGPLTVQNVQHILSAHDSDEFPVCRHVRPELGKMASCTNNTLIMVLSSQPELHLTTQPPCEGKFQVFGFV